MTDATEKLDLPNDERIKFSTAPCPRCGWHHAWKDFSPALRPKVRVIGSPCYPPPESRHIAIGTVGTVYEVREYNGPMYVRVSFSFRQAPPKKPINLTFENYYPCDLEPA